MLGLLILFGFAATIIAVVGTLAIIHQLRHPPRTTYAQAMARNNPVEPADLGLAATEFTFRLSDGATSPGWLIQGRDQATGGGGGAPVIVVTHGWGDSRVGALQTVPMLVGLARAVVVYDLRAHGDSTAKRSDLGTTEVDDLLAIVDQIDPVLGPVVLFGYSMGAGISIAAAAQAADGGAKSSGQSAPLPPGEGGRYPGRVRAWQTGDSRINALRSMQDSASFVPPRPHPAGRPATLSRGERGNPRIRGVIGEGVYRWGMEPIYGFFHLNRWPTWPFLWLVGLHLNFWVRRNSLFDRARHAARLGCPLLLLHGTADPICRFDSAQAVAAAAPDATLVQFEGGRHLDLAALDPDRYLEALTEFLQRIRKVDGPGATSLSTESSNIAGEARLSADSPGTPGRLNVDQSLPNPKSDPGAPGQNPKFL